MSEIDKKDSSKNKELVQRDEIKDSPFTVITTEEGSFVSMGQYRISEVFKTKTEAKKDAARNDWNRIVQVMILIKDFKTKE